MPQECPICDREVKPNPRYPKYVCRKCVERVTALDGEKIELFQSGSLGLFAARYVASGEEYLDHECLIDGVKCVAGVARFGGIVVEKIDGS